MQHVLDAAFFSPLLLLKQFRVRIEMQHEPNWPKMEG